MSVENVEIVARFYPDTGVDMAELVADEDAMERFEASVRPFFHPDAETTLDPRFASLSDAGEATRRGMDGFREVWQDWLSAWESFRLEVEELRPLSDSRVLALVGMHGRPKTGDLEIPLGGAAIWTLINSRVRRVELFLDREQALKAAGLSE